MDATVAVLAGGLGTRISGVLGDTPKVLGPVGGRPFLDWLLDKLQTQGVQHVILLLGHLAQKVQDHLAENPRTKMFVETIIEPSPLGTLGAIRYGAASMNMVDVIVLNGDTFIDADLKPLLARHR